MNANVPRTLRNVIVPQGVLGTPRPCNRRRLLLEPCLRNGAVPQLHSGAPLRFMRFAEPFRKLFPLFQSFLNAAERNRSARKTLRNAIVPQGILGTPRPFNRRRLLLEPFLRHGAVPQRH